MHYLLRKKLVSFLKSSPPFWLRSMLGRIVNRIGERFPLFAMLYSWFVFGIVVKPVVQKRMLIIYKGNKILFPGRNWSHSLAYMKYDEYEQFFSVREGDIVIDIGAHVGSFAIKAAKRCGDEGLVVAIEPEPGNFALLSENVRNNQLNNVRIISKAVGGQERRQLLHLSFRSTAHSLLMPMAKPNNTYVYVEVDSLDSIISELGLSHVDFIKINAEGAELEILRGAERVLKMPGVKLVISTHTLSHEISTFPEVASDLISRGFKIHTKGKELVYASLGTAIDQ